MDGNTLLQALVIVIVIVAGGLLAKSYFRKAKLTKDDQEIWKKNAINHNKELDNALNKKDEKAYSELLHPKASRFQPRMPYRVEGSGEVLKKVKSQMESVSGSTSIMQSSAELHKEVLLVTYNFMTDGKIGEKFVEGSGKVTRVWVRVKDGWKLIHEHVSEN